MDGTLSIILIGFVETGSNCPGISLGFVFIHFLFYLRLLPVTFTCDYSLVTLTCDILPVASLPVTFTCDFHLRLINCDFLLVIFAYDI